MNILRPILSAFTIFLLSFGAGRAGAASAVTASADTFVLASQPDSNYGGAGALQVVAAANTKGEYQSLLRFDLSSTVAGFNATYGVGMWTINSITLSLGTNFGVAGTQPNNAIFAPIAPGNFNVTWQANDSWLEGTGSPSGATTDGLTFNQLPTYVSAANDRAVGTFAFTAPGNNTVSTYALGLDNSFTGDVSAGGLVSLRISAADSSVSYLFNSRTFGTASQRPILLVDVVPEPATPVMILVASLLAAALWRRARQA